MKKIMFLFATALIFSGACSSNDNNEPNDNQNNFENENSNEKLEWEEFYNEKEKRELKEINREENKGNEEEQKPEEDKEKKPEKNDDEKEDSEINNNQNSTPPTTSAELSPKNTFREWLNDYGIVDGYEVFHEGHLGEGFEVLYENHEYVLGTGHYGGMVGFYRLLAIDENKETVHIVSEITEEEWESFEDIFSQGIDGMKPIDKVSYMKKNYDNKNQLWARYDNASPEYRIDLSEQHKKKTFVKGRGLSSIEYYSDDVIEYFGESQKATYKMPDFN